MKTYESCDQYHKTLQIVFSKINRRCFAGIRERKKCGQKFQYFLKQKWQARTGTIEICRLQPTIAEKRWLRTKKPHTKIYKTSYLILFKKFSYYLLMSYRSSKKQNVSFCKLQVFFSFLRTIFSVSSLNNCQCTANAVVFKVFLYLRPPRYPELGSGFLFLKILF